MARPRERGPWFWRTAIAVMITSVFGLFAVAAFNTPPALDQETACRLDRNDPAHTILLIDQSDPFNTNDLDWVYEFVDSEARALPKYGRLTVLTPNASDPYQPTMVFSQCSPGSVDDANAFFQNPRMIDDTWRDTFYTPLVGEVETAMVDTRQPSSPLSEAVYAIADRADFQPSHGDRRVVLVSDLMQHSDDFSFYKVGADFTAFGETRLGEQIPDMSDIEVVARIVPRQMYDLPLNDVKAFWRAYFRQSGAIYGSVN
ncbi:MAG: hypothetical protein AAFQ99_09670 [Pseudomonadota bacterium]